MNFLATFETISFIYIFFYYISIQTLYLNWMRGMPGERINDDVKTKIILPQAHSIHQNIDLCYLRKNVGQLFPVISNFYKSDNKTFLQIYVCLKVSSNTQHLTICIFLSIKSSMADMQIYNFLNICNHSTNKNH